MAYEYMKNILMVWFYLLKYKTSVTITITIILITYFNLLHMFVQGKHLNFTVEKDPDETHELHRARVFAIAALLDEHPEYVQHFDKLVEESKRYVALHEARCHPMPSNFNYFMMRKPVASTVPIRSTKGIEAAINKTNPEVPIQTSNT